jgi:hypothetical protein
MKRLDLSKPLIFVAVMFVLALLLTPMAHATGKPEPASNVATASKADASSFAKASSALDLGLSHLGLSQLDQERADAVGGAVGGHGKPFGSDSANHRRPVGSSAACRTSPTRSSHRCAARRWRIRCANAARLACLFKRPPRSAPRPRTPSPRPCAGRTPNGCEGRGRRS